MSGTYSVYLVDEEEGTRDFVESFSDVKDAIRRRDELQDEIDADEDAPPMHATWVEE